MMSDADILNAMVIGEIKVKHSRGYDASLGLDIQPNSLDVYMKPYVTDKKGKIIRKGDFRSTGYVEIKPLEFVLATTQEYIKLANSISASVETRSSIGRLGIFTQNAGHIDAGFEGEITLELFNASNESVFINPDKPIAQLVFTRLDTPAVKGYCGDYQGQREVRPSKMIGERND